MQLLMDVLVVMVKRFPWQQVHLWILIALTNDCTNFELYMTSECKLFALAYQFATRNVTNNSQLATGNSQDQHIFHTRKEAAILHKPCFQTNFQKHE